MNDQLSLYGDRRMTVREVADALEVHIDTVHSWIDKLYPGLKQNGITTYLDEEQVTRIKQAMNQNSHLRTSPKVTTALEIEEMTLKVISYHKAEADRLRAELAVATPKAEIADRIASADGLKSLSEVGKINGIGPRKIFDILVGLKIIYRSGRSWVPYQEYIDSGAFVVRESTYEANGIDHLYSKTYVTGKGELWLARRLFAEAAS